jgi:DNA-binding MarR family transcriptional regulator
MGPSVASPHGPAHPQHLSYRVRRLYLLMAQRIDDALKPFGIARTQWQVLSRVRRAGTLSQKDIQQALQIESATLTCVVDSLAGKGWLERLEDPRDKRVRLLRLTPEGEERLAHTPDPYVALETRMLQGVGPRDRAAVEKALELMIHNLEDRS